MGSIHRAAVLKRGTSIPPDVPERVAQVVATARQNAEARGLDPDLYGDFWHALVEAAIGEEARRLAEPS